MVHSRSHGAHRSKPAEVIELGNEPPLSVDGGTSGFVDRRRVSVQWFAGTILTALCGAALMGGAVFTSLDGETNFASLPEQVSVVLRGALGISADRLGASRKSDRLPTAGEPSFARQIIRVSTISQVGNHEVVRVRPFVRFAGNLALNATEISADIPPFNPQRLLADSAPGSSIPVEVPEAQPDAEVAFVMRDLPAMLPKVKIALLTPRDDVIARVYQAAEWSEQQAASQLPIAASITGVKLAYAGVGGEDPYAGFEARVVPENVTLLPKTAKKTTGGNPFNERTIIAKKADSLASILADLGATEDEIAAISRVLAPSGGENAVKEGEKLRVLLSPTPGSEHLQPVRVIIADDASIKSVIALSDTGNYVAVDASNLDAEIAEHRDEEAVPQDAVGISLYQSIYETALRNSVPHPIIDEFIRIYSFDVDLQRKVQPGDSFEVVYAGDDEGPAADMPNDVLYTALTIGGETKKLYRFKSPDDGLVDYYDENGKSAKKFLVRKPIAEGVMRSGFGLRRHPILGYVKMHTGVDWAAPRGTPIYAAGNGVVVKEGWESGYGKFILIRHNNGYETAYAHLSAYARGIEEGKQVRQGQIVGFAGSTGLSTGSHLHFEIRINDRFVDPMRIKLPRGRELQGAVLAAFDEERERIDEIVSRKPSRIASSR